MWYINKVANKLMPVILSSNGLYRTISRFISGIPTTLPSYDESLAILEKASSRPDSGLDVKKRNWPATPLFDISVIVPCYNSEEFIVDCIQSILHQQTHYSFEIICVDDGSTDKTPEILDNFSKSDSRVHVIHQHNMGFSGARNTGIANVQGKTIMFVDSDDVIPQNAIEELSRAYYSDEVDYVTGLYSKLSGDGTKTFPIKGKRTHGAPWGRLYSREVWRELEFPVGFWFEDTVQGFCIDSVYREKCIDVPVYLYRRNTSGISSTAGKSKKSLDTLWIVDEMLNWCDKLQIPMTQKMYDRVLFQFGRIMWWRTTALTGKEHKAMFVYASTILHRINQNGLFSTNLGGRWKDVEKGLVTKNYQLWRLAVASM